MPEPIPILFTIPNFVTAGSGRALVNIVKRLDRERYTPAICVSKQGGDLEDEVKALGIPLLVAPFTVPARPVTSLMANAWKASRQFAPFRFRIWHSFHYLDDYTEPIIARLAGARWWVYTKKNMNWGRRSWVLRSLLASRILAQNTTMLDRFFNGWPWRRRVRLIPRGVDIERFHPDVEQRLSIRSMFKIPGEAVLAACVAHLVPVKGHSTLVRAVERVKHLHLLVAGKELDSEYAQGLKDLAYRLGIADRVHFVGGVSDIPALLAEAEVFVLPTYERGEGCPVALLEGMSSGRACIATRVPGSLDLIVPEKSGLVVAPEDEAELASSLARLADSPELRRRLGAGARQRAVNHYSLQVEVEAHESLYKELLQ